MHVDEASALEDTLMRLRQRYALYFYLPEGPTTGHENTEVGLSEEARLRYHDAEVRYRRVYMGASTAGERSGAPGVTRPSESPIEEPSLPSEQPIPKSGRRTAVNEDSGPVVNTVTPDSDVVNQKETQPPKSQAAQPASPATSAPQSGWPRVNPQNPPQ